MKLLDDTLLNHEVSLLAQKLQLPLNLNVSGKLPQRQQQKCY